MKEDSFTVLGVPVYPARLEDTLTFLLEKTSASISGVGYIIFRDVHGVIRCQDDPAFLNAHKQALRVCPDGMPLVWLGRRKGHKQIERVYGPDLMRGLMKATQSGNRTHFLYGGKPGVAENLQKKLESQFPGVKIVGIQTPPFGPLSLEEIQALRKKMEQVSPDFFWVGLSTPKQELFMQTYSSQLNTGIMFGVGAAFDYLSGEVKEPPVWVQRSGFQWLWRIAQEPKRLAGRYFNTVPRFLWLLLKEKVSQSR